MPSGRPHGRLRAAKVLRKVALVSQLFALHMPLRILMLTDNRLPPPGVNMWEGNNLIDPELEDDMSNEDTALWVD